METVQLRRIELRRGARDLSSSFPFSVPSIASLDPLDLSTAVTFFVGENGSGKSTLMEGIASAASLPTVGSQPVDRDETLAAQRLLAKQLKLTWQKRAHRGFFLRAEDFFGFARSISKLRADLQQRVADVEEEFRDASAYARGLAAGPAAGSIAAMERMYGTELDARSHGESFLRLFESRLVPGGLYLLDEPEAALSPQSQLALLAMIAETVGAGSQFIIATHSPILLAYPGASIYSFDMQPVGTVSYDELEHVAITRSFLNDPHRYLRHLFPDTAD